MLSSRQTESLTLKTERVAIFVQGRKTLGVLFLVEVLNEYVLCSSVDYGSYFPLLRLPSLQTFLEELNASPSGKCHNQRCPA